MCMHVEVYLKSLQMRDLETNTDQALMFFLGRGASGCKSKIRKEGNKLLHLVMQKTWIHANGKERKVVHFLGDCDFNKSLYVLRKRKQEKRKGSCKRKRGSIYEKAPFSSFTHVEECSDVPLQK